MEEFRLSSSPLEGEDSDEGEERIVVRVNKRFG